VRRVKVDVQRVLASPEKPYSDDAALTGKTCEMTCAVLKRAHH
jgi:hypothetical protein